MKHALLPYVLHHFLMVYDVPEQVQISYGRAGKVSIKQGDLSFFDKQIPKPKQVQWAEWQGQQIPFFFDDNLPASLLSESENAVNIHADIVASAFYLLSGWQEYYSDVRDQFGRFPYKESVQFRYGFVEIPVVNYYFDILKTAIEKAYQIKLQRKLWPESSFATCITHDIDRLNSAWKVWGTEAIKAGKIGMFFKLFSQKCLKNDAWNNLSELQKTIENYGAHSTFFFLTSQDKFKNHPAADYDVTAPEIQQQIKKLAAAGHEIGVHGSFGTATNIDRFLTEIRKINQKTVGNRFHYLIYDPQQTPQVLEKSGLAYDSSLGFAEHFGFRNSYCFPFQSFDFEKKQLYNFIEIPLNLMDTTLLPHYMNIKPGQVLEKVKPLLQQIEKFGGCFTLLWHNEYFANQEQKGKELLEELLEYCQIQQSRFYLCKNVTVAVQKEL